MKTAILSYFILLFSPIFVAHLLAQTPTQYNISGDAKVGLIVSGTGNTINTTQIFGKSPEYAELKKIMDKYEADIAKKAATCEKMAKDNLPAEYRDGCRSELVMLNSVRDSVAKIEKRFREDVIRLAETFSNLKINSERLRLAKQFFEEGKIREADQILKAGEMKAEGDELLAEKARQQEKLHRTDSLLRIKADEFALKARLKATDYADALRYDSAKIYFDQSLVYAQSAENLRSFARLLLLDHQAAKAAEYYEKALQLPHSGAEDAKLKSELSACHMELHNLTEAETMLVAASDTLERLAGVDPKKHGAAYADATKSLADTYSKLQKLPEAEKTYLRALTAMEAMAKADSAKYEVELAGLLVNMGVFNFYNHNLPQAEKYYLRALGTYESRANTGATADEMNIARLCLNMGVFYNSFGKDSIAEKMYRRSIDLNERLVKTNPARFEPMLVYGYMNYAVLFARSGNYTEAEKWLLRAIEVQERLAKANPASFEPILGQAAMNLGIVYKEAKRFTESEKMYLRSLEITQRMAKKSPAQFELELMKVHQNIGALYHEMKNGAASERAYELCLELGERLSKEIPERVEALLVDAYWGAGQNLADLKKMAEAERLFLRSLEIADRLAKNSPETATSKLVEVLSYTAYFHIAASKFAEAAEYGARLAGLQPPVNYGRMQIGHAHLFRHDWEKAKAAYSEYLKNEPDAAVGKAAILSELDEFEGLGVTCAEVGKAREWLKK